jgi:TAZ zinc finger
MADEIRPCGFQTRTMNKATIQQRKLQAVMSAPQDDRASEKLAMQRFSLIELAHAKTCQASHCIVDENCGKMKKLWNHMSECSIEKACFYPICSLSKEALRHVRSCRDDECRVCGKNNSMRLVKDTLTAYSTDEFACFKDDEMSLIAQLSSICLSQEKMAEYQHMLSSIFRRREKSLQHHLIQMAHAKTCQSNHCLVIKTCGKMKQLWDHMSECSPEMACTLPQCLISKTALHHVRTCRNHECALCGRFHNTTLVKYTLSGYCIDEAAYYNDDEASTIAQLPRTCLSREKIAEYQPLLFFIIHAQNCDRSACCRTTQCAEAKNLCAHLKTCENASCTFWHCAEGKHVALHQRQCRDLKCEMCIAFRQMCSVRKSRFSALINGTRA